MALGKGRFFKGRVHVLEGTEATCKDCGLVYPSGLRIEFTPDTRHLAFGGTIPGTAACPRCGGPGTVGEMYALVGDGLLRFTESGLTIAQMTVVADILRAAIARKETSVAPVVAEIREKAPDQKGIIDWLNRISPAGQLLVGILTLFLTALTLLATRYPNEPSARPHDPIPVEAINAAIKEAMAAQKTIASEPSPVQDRKDKNKRKRERRRR